MTYTFKRRLMNINKSPRRINRNAGGRNKNPVIKLMITPMYKPNAKADGKLYSRKNSPF